MEKGEIKKKKEKKKRNRKPPDKSDRVGMIKESSGSNGPTASPMVQRSGGGL